MCPKLRIFVHDILDTIFLLKSKLQINQSIQFLREKGAAGATISTLNKKCFFSNLNAEGCNTRHIRGSRQQLVPRCVRIGIESSNATSWCAQQPSGSFERARQALPDRADVARRSIERMRERTGLQFALGSGLSTQPDGHGTALSTAVTRAGSGRQSSGLTWY